MEPVFSEISCGIPGTGEMGRGYFRMASIRASSSPVKVGFRRLSTLLSSWLTELAPIST